MPPGSVDARIASIAVWFDAFVTNIDRTARNPNLLWWHKALYFIDHGASLYFHHNWEHHNRQDIEQKACARFPQFGTTCCCDGRANSRKWMANCAHCLPRHCSPRYWRRFLTHGCCRSLELEFPKKSGGLFGVLPAPAERPAAVCRGGLACPRCTPLNRHHSCGSPGGAREFINAGVIVFCLGQKFLQCRLHVDAERLQALWPQMDIEEVRRHLAAFPEICAGAPDAGPVARLSERERFHWLVAPRSTVIQISPVTAGFASRRTLRSGTFLNGWCFRKLPLGESVQSLLPRETHLSWSPA